jgi:tripartite-type tricarboxylate transporter receptor subunit TctC
VGPLPHGGGLSLHKEHFSLESFVHLGTVFGSAATINVRLDSRAKTLQDLVDQPKKEPLKIGLSAIGADDHLATLRLMKISGAKFAVIPLGDSGTVPLALIRGDVDVVMTSLNTAARMQDQLRTLAVSSATPVDVLPNRRSGSQAMT